MATGKPGGAPPPKPPPPAQAAGLASTRRRGSPCSARSWRSACWRNAPTTCSCRTSSRGPAISRWGRRRWRPDSRSPCAATTTPSAPTAGTRTRWRAADRASAYGLERQVVDGNDADAVYAAAAAAIGRARGGEGPSLIEAMTYRYSGHSRADPAKYRPAGELEEWMKRDPIALYRARLIELGVPESALRDMEGAVQRAVDEATETAKASAPSSVDVIDRDVWADGGSSWRN